MCEYSSYALLSISLPAGCRWIDFQVWRVYPNLLVWSITESIRISATHSFLFCSSSPYSYFSLFVCLLFEQSFPLKTHPRLFNHCLTPPALHYSSNPPYPLQCQTQWKVLPRWWWPHMGFKYPYNNISELISFVTVEIYWLQTSTIFLIVQQHEYCLWVIRSQSRFGADSKYWCYKWVSCRRLLFVAAFKGRSKSLIHVNQHDSMYFSRTFPFACLFVFVLY